MNALTIFDQLNTRFTALRGKKFHGNEGWLITNTKRSPKPILPTYCGEKNPKRMLRYFKKNEYELVLSTCLNGLFNIYSI